MGKQLARESDLVLVIENGRITQSGTHAQLMAEDGHYREIAAVQLFGDETRGLPSELPSHMDRMLDKQEATVAVADDDGGVTEDPGR